MPDAARPGARAGAGRRDGRAFLRKPELLRKSFNTFTNLFPCLACVWDIRQSEKFLEERLCGLPH